MKNLSVLIMALALLALVACHNNLRHVVITDDSSDDHALRIEYYGNINFTNNGDGIRSISPRGSAYYRANNEELLAQSDFRGHITYRVNDGPRERELDKLGRDLLARAVKIMIKRGHYHKDL